MKKKFTMLFAALFLVMGTAWAQISALSELDNSKAYLLKNANDMGYAIWKDGDNLTLCGATGSYTKFTDALDATAAGSNWQIINYDSKYYLYNVGAQKFAVTQQGATYLTETPTAISVESVDKGFAFNSTGNSHHYMCATHGDGHTYPLQWWHSSDNGSAWQIIENNDVASISDLLNGATVVEEFFNQYVQVTFEYYIDGKLYKKSEPVDHLLEATKVPALAYVNVESFEPATITEACTVKVTCTENLPFEASESYENAKWYVVDMHSNDNGVKDIIDGVKKYVWTYAADGTPNVVLPQDASKQTATFGDEKLWCFVGNLIDGFKIYNKAAGAGMTLNKAEDGNNGAGMSNADATLYALVGSGEITGATCFLPKGHTYYLNTQEVNGVKVLKGWTDPDGGSSCRFFAPTDFVENTMQAYLMPANAIGAPTELTTERAEAINTAYTAI